MKPQRPITPGQRPSQGAGPENKAEAAPEAPPTESPPIPPVPGQETIAVPGLGAKEVNRVSFGPVPSEDPTRGQGKRVGPPQPQEQPPEGSPQPIPQEAPKTSKAMEHNLLSKLKRELAIPHYAGTPKAYVVEESGFKWTFVEIGFEEQTWVWSFMAQLREFADSGVAGTLQAQASIVAVACVAIDGNPVFEVFGIPTKDGDIDATDKRYGTGELLAPARIRMPAADAMRDFLLHTRKSIVPALFGAYTDKTGVGLDEILGGQIAPLSPGPNTTQSSPE